MPRPHFIKLTMAWPGKLDGNNTVQGMTAVGDYLDPASGNRVILFEQSKPAAVPKKRAKTAQPATDAAMKAASGKTDLFPGGSGPVA